MTNFIIDREAREMIESVASVRPSVRQCALSQLQQRAKKSHNQFEEFVCVSNNCADAVDRLLMLSVLSTIIYLIPPWAHHQVVPSL